MKRYSLAGLTLGLSLVFTVCHGATDRTALTVIADW